MPGLFLWQERTPADVGPMRVGPFNVANSQSIYLGDPVVQTTVTGSQARIRLVSAADIAALYKDGSANIVGLLGITAYDIFTDSSGNAANPTSPTPLAANVKCTYPINSWGAFAPPDPVSGRMTASVFSVAAQNFGGSLWENTTVTESLVGVAVGLLLSTLSGVGYWFWSTAATTKIGTIQDVDEANPLFNTAVTANVQDTTHNNRCPVAVRISATYDSLANLFPTYAT